MAVEFVVELFVDAESLGRHAVHRRGGPCISDSVPGTVDQRRSGSGGGGGGSGGGGGGDGVRRRRLRESGAERRKKPGRQFHQFGSAAADCGRLWCGRPGRPAPVGTGSDPSPSVPASDVGDAQSDQRTSRRLVHRVVAQRQSDHHQRIVCAQARFVGEEGVGDVDVQHPGGSEQHQLEQHQLESAPETHARSGHGPAAVAGPQHQSQRRQPPGGAGRSLPTASRIGPEHAEHAEHAEHQFQRFQQQRFAQSEQSGHDHSSRDVRHAESEHFEEKSRQTAAEEGGGATGTVAALHSAAGARCRQTAHRCVRLFRLFRLFRQQLQQQQFVARWQRHARSDHTEIGFAILSSLRDAHARASGGFCRSGCCRRRLRRFRR